jgi:hypothetical protein
LLMLVAPRLLLVWVVKLLAALVLFEVSAARVVVALKAVPADAKSDEKTSRTVTQTAYIRTIHPRNASPRKKRRMRLNRMNFVGALFQM